MKLEKALKMFFRCLCIALAFFVIVFGSTFLFYSVHVLEAPYILLTDSQRLGKKLGSVVIRWNGKEKLCRVYNSKHLVYSSKGGSRLISCLLIYPPFRLFRFPYGHALKITEDSVGIFNDGPTECLPMGKWIYESDMTYPVISVDNDMKGWDAKYEITREKTGIRYRIYPSKYSNRDIDFTVPFSYFEKLK
ncbi:MAG: hypothetical protein J5858_00070 [Lentisphaeria bacterium]|nr:hypothetical protein [Lentisphaeria bacterium]